MENYFRISSQDNIRFDKSLGFEKDFEEIQDLLNKIEENKIAKNIRKLEIYYKIIFYFVSILSIGYFIFAFFVLFKHIKIKILVIVTATLLFILFGFILFKIIYKSKREDNFVLISAEIIRFCDEYNENVRNNDVKIFCHFNSEIRNGSYCKEKFKKHTYNLDFTRQNNIQPIQNNQFLNKINIVQINNYHLMENN